TFTFTASTSDTTAPTITAVSDSPDPFTPNGDSIQDTSTIFYTLSEAATATLKIYDAGNNLVRTLVNGFARTSGAHSEIWNGKNDAGIVQLPGTYTYKIDAKDSSNNSATQQTGTVTIAPNCTAPTITCPSPVPLQCYSA